MKALTDLRIIFMGTPEFAVATLKRLVNEGCNVVAVVTTPDKPAGRGMHLQQSAVKIFATAHNIPILEPTKFKDPAFLEKLKHFQADIQVVVAFKMLPEVVWNMPPMGTINVHGSLLPQYRGAAPINWAIINGEKETGVTTFRLRHEIDTGDILLSAPIPIQDDDNAGTLHDKMKEAGANLLLKTLKQLTEDKIIPQPQLHIVDHLLKPAPKIFTETCQIHWENEGEKIHNLIRGLSPYPTAFTYLFGKKLKIFSGEIIKDKQGKPGELFTDGKTYLGFYTGNGGYKIVDLQLEGKKRMNVEDFLRGYHFPNNQ